VRSERGGAEPPFLISSTGMSEPRVLVVMQAQWPRALLLAALVEDGYDAVGAASLEEALAQPVQAAGREPVGLIVVDHHISRDDPRLQTLLQRHPQAKFLFLESAFGSSQPEPPEHRLRYPAFIGEVIQAVERLLPLSPKTIDHRGTKDAEDL
jgi:CheY-like chemotaxis protein